MFILGQISLVNAHDSLSSPLEAGVEVEKEKQPLFWNLLLRGRKKKVNYPSIFY